MPEISIGHDSTGRPEFVCAPLDGDDLARFDKAHLFIDTAMSYICSYRRARLNKLYVAEEYRNKAEKTLCKILPEETAKKLINAVLEDKKDTKVTFHLPGNT